jgi:hypothetical protein
MMRVYCGRFDPQVGVTLIGYDEPTRSDEDLWAADLTSPTNSVIECLLLEQSPNRLQLAVNRLIADGFGWTPCCLSCRQ